MMKKNSNKLLEREIKWTNIVLFVSVFLNVLCIVVLFSFGNLTVFKSEPQHQITYYGTNISKYIDIDYLDLSEKQINNLEEIMKDIKPKYLAGSKRILFVKNISEYCDYCNGINFRRGYPIVIKYRDDFDSLRGTICHELLHTHIMAGNISHEIVYDLDEYQTCFRKSEEGYV